MESRVGGTDKDDPRKATSGPRVCHQARSENAARKPSATYLGIRTPTGVVGPWCSVESGLTEMTEGTRA